MYRHNIDVHITTVRIDDYPEELEDPELPMQRTLLRPGLSPLSSLGQGETSGPTSFDRASETPSTDTIVPDNKALMDICRGFVDTLQRGMAPWVIQRLNTACGPMPTDASSFSFWMAMVGAKAFHVRAILIPSQVLPIDDTERAKLLPIKSPRLRLRLVVHWIEQLNSNWPVP